MQLVSELPESPWPSSLPQYFPWLSVKCATTVNFFDPHSGQETSGTAYYASEGSDAHAVLKGLRSDNRVVGRTLDVGVAYACGSPAQGPA